MAIITRNLTDGSSTKLFDTNIDSGGTTTAQGMIPAPMATMGSFMLILENPATFTATVTVWASNKPQPDPTVDTDWVDISSVISDIPTISAVAADINYMIQVPQAEGGALYYRLKIVAGTNDSDVACVATFKKVK